MPALTRRTWRSRHRFPQELTYFLPSELGRVDRRDFHPVELPRRYKEIGELGKAVEVALSEWESAVAFADRWLPSGR